MAGQCGPDQVPPGAIALLGGAIRYALGACAQVTPTEMTRPTPCADWDLAALLSHLATSMADLESALRTGSADPWAANPADLTSPRPGLPGDTVEMLRDQAANLLITCYAHQGRNRFVQLADVPLAAGIVAAAAAVEIAVHGWDVSAARGPAEEIPPGLAARMLGLCPLLVASRDGLFAPPVVVPPGAPPGDQLVAYLGRNPASREPGRNPAPG